MNMSKFVPGQCHCDSMKCTFILNLHAHVDVIVPTTIPLLVANPPSNYERLCSNWSSTLRGRKVSPNLRWLDCWFKFV